MTDEQWTILEPLVPPGKPGGRRREVDMREVINTILYQLRTGCPWDYLPHDLSHKSTANGYFARWRDDGTWQQIMDALREKVREQTPLPLPKSEQATSGQQPTASTSNEQQGTTSNAQETLSGCNEQQAALSSQEASTNPPLLLL